MRIVIVSFLLLASAAAQDIVRDVRIATAQNNFALWSSQITPRPRANFHKWPAL